MKNMSTDLLS